LIVTQQKMSQERRKFNVSWLLCIIQTRQLLINFV